MIRLVLVSVLVTTALPAHAQPSFEARADGALRIRHVEDVVWALTATCDQGDDTAQRQCRQLRDRKARALTGATLVVDAEPDAFVLGRWQAGKKSVPLTLTACVRCGGVSIAGKTWYVVGSGAPLRAEGDRLVARTLYDNARVFPDEVAATTWIQALRGLRVELVVKLPAKPVVQVGGKSGPTVDVLALDIVGWRVVNPCDGSIVIADPSSGTIAPEPRACRVESR